MQQRHYDGMPNASSASSACKKDVHALRGGIVLADGRVAPLLHYELQLIVFTPERFPSLHTYTWAPLGCCRGRALNRFAKLVDVLHNASAVKLLTHEHLSRNERVERANEKNGRDSNSELQGVLLRDS